MEIDKRSGSPPAPGAEGESPEVGAESMSSGVRIEVKKPVRSVPSILVPTPTYNAIRSFVESSENPKYEWNIGLKVDNRIIFRKRGKWTLEIFPDAAEELADEPESITAMSVAILSSWRGEEILTLFIDRQGYFYFDIQSRRINPRIEWCILPDSDVPFARPILLSEVVSKLETYISMPFSVQRYNAAIVPSDIPDDKG